MANRDYKAFIVEGEAREPLIIDNISKVFFAHGNIKIITLPAGQNIYMLWKKLKEDDFDTDIIEVLREEHEELEKQLSGLSRDDFSEVYLFFDYDGHQNNLGESDESDALEQMLIPEPVRCPVPAAVRRSPARRSSAFSSGNTESVR